MLCILATMLPTATIIASQIDAIFLTTLVEYLLLRMQECLLTKDQDFDSYVRMYV